MKKTFLFLNLLFLFNCYSQNDKFSVSHGQNLKYVDTLTEKVLEIKFENCEFVAFPEKYAEKINGTGKTYFIPDSSTIMYINQNIAKQYCYAQYKFMEDYYKRNLNEDDNDNRRKLKKEYAKFKKNSLKNCQKFEEKINQFDKQIIGYVNENGEKIVLIQMIDFTEDPYNLKPVFEKSWIDGWHGWFESNVRRLHFHIKNNEFTMNEDI